MSRPVEFVRIDALQRIFRRSDREMVGLGDDAAVIEVEGRRIVSTVDAAVDGVHFDRGWLSLDEIGFRAFMAAASDLAAMGARGSHALCAWTLPPYFEDADLWELARGVERASRQCECPVVGGNLARSRELTLTTTAIGSLWGDPVRRSGGRPGDRLWVTGPLGAPRVGLQIVQRAHHSGADARHEPFLSALRAPHARLDLGAKLAESAHCAIDLSDGLLGDLEHLCTASEVGARLELARLPRHPDHEALCRELGLDWVQALLAGGEEYELLFAAPPELDLPWATAIGSLCEAGRGIEVVDEGGARVPPPEGFEHFESR